jgi:hypothetical protein
MMESMHPVAEAFAPILGLPSWEVKKGHGSFVTMEFGEPLLRIAEPRMRPVFIESAPAQMMTRDAYVRGQWHLWIYCCVWSLSFGSVRLTHCESEDVSIARGLSVLNGQALSGVEVDPENGATTFTFDLGCILSTVPAVPGTYGENPVDQWKLHQPSGQVLQIREDGRYRQQRGDQPNDPREWTELPGYF